jgi:hypothetical protein
MLERCSTIGLAKAEGDLDGAIADYNLLHLRCSLKLQIALTNGAGADPGDYDGAIEDCDLAPRSIRP